MAANRAEKSGLAKEMQNKVAGKYDQERACEIMKWVGNSIGDEAVRECDGSAKSVHELLSDGLVLAKLAHWAVPQHFAKVPPKAPTMAFKKMALIGEFNAAIKQVLLSHNTFETPDLYEEMNMNQVIICLEALGRHMQKSGAGHGHKESEKNERQFTEEQLKSGQNIIGLQMGTNKGASQAGQNFGKSRGIND